MTNYRWVKLAVIAALCMAAFAGHAKADWPRNSLYQVDVALTDQAGVSSQWSSGAATKTEPKAAPNSVHIVSMFYSSCDYVCPMLFEAIKNIEANLPEESRSRLQVGLITLDPQRDDVAKLAKTAQQRGGDPSRWHLYRTPPADVRRMAATLGVRYRELSGGEFNHSTVMVLLDAQGVELARTENIATLDAEFLKAVKAATR